MRNREFAIIILLALLLSISVLVNVCWADLSEDLSKKVIKQENEINELLWEMSQIDQMICNNGEQYE